jgi:hypothetical protein
MPFCATWPTGISRQIAACSEFTIDPKLTFSKHISSIAHIAHIRSKLTLRSFASKQPQILTKAFITYLRPLLEYCTRVWSPHTLDNIDKIEAVQRRFTKRFEGLSNLSYHERLKILSLDSLELRRLKYDLPSCYRIIRGDIDISLDGCFEPSAYSSTRGHSQKLFKHQFRLDTRNYFFANRIMIYGTICLLLLLNLILLKCLKQDLILLILTSIVNPCRATTGRLWTY